MEVEQEAVLTSMGEELDVACRSLARNGEDKLQVFYFFNIIFNSVLFCFVWCACLKLHLAIFGHYRAKRLQNTLTQRYNTDILLAR